VPNNRKRVSPTKIAKAVQDAIKKQPLKSVQPTKSTQTTPKFKIKLSELEQETILRYNPLDKFWMVFTDSDAMSNKLKKLGYVENKDPKFSQHVFQLPKKAVSFRTPGANKRVLTEEQRKASADRLAAGRAKKSQLDG
jgi:hypothetical protein